MKSIIQIFAIIIMINLNIFGLDNCEKEYKTTIVSIEEDCPTGYSEKFNKEFIYNNKGTDWIEPETQKVCEIIEYNQTNCISVTDSDLTEQEKTIIEKKFSKYKTSTEEEAEKEGMTEAEKRKYEEEKERFKSCSEIKRKYPASETGVYKLWQGYNVACDMDTSGGGWTLVMSSNGRDFNYDSGYWTKPNQYGNNPLENSYKSLAFNEIPLTEILLQINNKNIILNKESKSMLQIFSDKGYQATTLGKSTWKQLVKSPSLQNNCNKEGFNVYASGARVRIGIIGNQENDCNSPDSRIGFGGNGSACGQDNSISTGNTAYCSADAGNRNDALEGKIWVRDFNINDKQEILTQTAEDKGEVQTQSNSLNQNVINGSEKSCAEIKLKYNKAKSGVFEITQNSKKQKVYCDMETDGGGWTLVMNLDTSDGHKMHWDNGWLTNKTIGTISEPFNSDYKNQEQWDTLPLNSIMIKNHEQGDLNALKAFKLLDSFKGKTLKNIFDIARRSDVTLPHYLYTKSKDISSDYLKKDPIMSGEGQLAFNWYYSNNGVRIINTGNWKSKIGQNDDKTRGLGTHFCVTPNDTYNSKEVNGCNWEIEASGNDLRTDTVGNGTNSCIGSDCEQQGSDYKSNKNYDYAIFIREIDNQLFEEIKNEQEQNKKIESCLDIKEKDSKAVSGEYTINPTGSKEYKVYCDMDTDGGGWTMAIRLNPNDNEKQNYVSNFWSKRTEVGNLTDNQDYISKIGMDTVPGEIKLTYKYDDTRTLTKIYTNNKNIDTLYQNYNLLNNNNNPIWREVYSNGNLSDNFFGNKLVFQTNGNGNDFSRIWYNLRGISDCNQGGSIGHNGDYPVNDWNWEIARGMKDGGSCQHNEYKLGIGKNYDKKSWGGITLSPNYDNGIMYISVRERKPITNSSEESTNKSCTDLLNNGTKESGIYTIKPNNFIEPFKVYCDMDTDGGGWTKIAYQKDLQYKQHFSGNDERRWITNDFNTQGYFELTNEQINAIREVSTEGKQTYKQRCNGVITYRYDSGKTYSYKLHFKMFDNKTTISTYSGQDSNTPGYGGWNITVPQDVCKTNGREEGEISKTTNFEIKSLSLPIINIQTKDNGGTNEKFGSNLTDNPAWFRGSVKKKDTLKSTIIYRNCTHAINEGEFESGNYMIQPKSSLNPFSVYCDMDNDGGGWTKVAYSNDLPYMGHFSGSDTRKWLSQDFNTQGYFELTNEQINAIRETSLEGKQRYVHRCNGVISYDYKNGNHLGYKIQFKLFNQEMTYKTDINETNHGYRIDWKLIQDGCKTNGGENGRLSHATIVDFKSLSLPIVNISTRDNQSSEWFGSNLTDNPVWFKGDNLTDKNVTSCSYIKKQSPSKQSGVYTVYPDGNTATKVYCDMDTSGGGWTLIAKFSNKDSKNWVSKRSVWKDGTSFGDTLSLSENKDAKSKLWDTLKANEIMWTDTKQIGKYLKTNNNCLNDGSLSTFFGKWIDSYPNTNGQNYKVKCTTDKTYLGAPTWLSEPDWNGNKTTSSNINVNNGYILFGKSDGTDTYSVISGYKEGYTESDVGLGADEGNSRGFSTDRYAQDVGGPTSCSYNDSTCRSEYPETVFMWVKESYPVIINTSEQKESEWVTITNEDFNDDGVFKKLYGDGSIVKTKEMFDLNVSSTNSGGQIKLDLPFTFKEMRVSFKIPMVSGRHGDDNIAMSDYEQVKQNDCTGALVFGTDKEIIKKGGEYNSDGLNKKENIYKKIITVEESSQLIFENHQKCSDAEDVRISDIDIKVKRTFGKKEVDLTDFENILSPDLDHSGINVLEAGTMGSFKEVSRSISQASGFGLHDGHEGRIKDWEPAIIAVKLKNEKPINKLSFYLHSNSFGDFSFEGSNNAGEGDFYNKGDWEKLSFRISDVKQRKENGGGYGSGYKDKTKVNFYYNNDKAYKYYRVVFKNTSKPNTTNEIYGGWATYVWEMARKNIVTCQTLKESDYKLQSGKFKVNPTGDKEIEVYCDMDTDGGGWTLVRRVTKNWDGLSDNLTGRQVKGSQLILPDTSATSTIKFDNIEYNDVLFRTGDQKYWMITDKDSIQSNWNNTCSNNATVYKSNFYSGPGKTVGWCKRDGNSEDPWISSENHGTGGHDSEHAMFYGEGWNGWLGYLTNNKGSNIYIRSKKPENKSTNKSCLTLLEEDNTRDSGYYKINPTGNKEVEVYCDMETDGGGWTQTYTLVSSGQSNGPVRSDMYNSINLYKDIQADSVLIDLENRWFTMNGITNKEFTWMWDSGHGHQVGHIANNVQTSIGKYYTGDEVTWQKWSSEIYQLNKNNGTWDSNVIFDLGHDLNHGAAFWDEANGRYKRLGGYQTPTNLTMKVKIRERKPENRSANKSCLTLLEEDNTRKSGDYRINPTGSEEIKVYCDMDTDGGGWTQTHTFVSSGQSNGPVRKDMYNSVKLFKDIKASAMLIDLENRWFIMNGLTNKEVSWMWDSGHGHQVEHIASSIQTSIGKYYTGDEVTWQKWSSEIYQLNKNNGTWDSNVIFDLGHDLNHGAAFWDKANGRYKRLGGYQTPTNLTMKVKVRERKPKSTGKNKSCLTLLEYDKTKISGKYIINPTGKKEIEVYCDMETDGGGWTYLSKDFAISTGSSNNYYENETIPKWRIKAEQKNNSGSHFGSHVTFDTEKIGGYSEVIFNQSAGNVNYSCAGVTWNSVFGLGTENLKPYLNNYYYPGWSTQNSKLNQSVTKNNYDYKNKISGTKINVGLGGYSGCSKPNHDFTVKVRIGEPQYKVQEEVKVIEIPKPEPESCLDIQKIEDNPQSGLYTIYPQGTEMKVYCNMNYQGGGWTLGWSNLQNFHGVEMRSRTWANSTNSTAELKGNTTTRSTNFRTGTPGNFEAFIGFSGWNKILNDKPGDFAFIWKANQSRTTIDQSFVSTIAPFNSSFRIYLTNYRQINGGNTSGLWSYHNGRNFMTYDRNNNGCASYYSSTPFWYGHCWSGNMNGGGENHGHGYYDGSYWNSSQKSWGNTSGWGAGAGWYFIRPSEVSVKVKNYLLLKNTKPEIKLNTYKSCLEIQKVNPNATSKIYDIRRNKVNMKVYCDMDTDGGGWTKITSSSITNGKHKTIKTDYPAKEFMTKYKGMIHYNYYGNKKNTHQLFDVFLPGKEKECYSSWHKNISNEINSTKQNPTYHYYKSACRWGTSNYEIPTGFYKNTFSEIVPVGTEVNFGDYKNISGDYSWNGRGYSGKQDYEIFFREETITMSTTNQNCQDIANNTNEELKTGKYIINPTGKKDEVVTCDFEAGKEEKIVYTESENLIKNGSFFAGNGIPGQSGSHGDNFIIEFESPISSGYALRQNGFAEYQLNMSSLTEKLEPNTKYKLGAWVYNTIDYNGDKMTHHSRWYDGNNKSYTTSRYKYIEQTETVGKNKWEYKTLVFETPNTLGSNWEWYVGYPTHGKMENPTGYRYVTGLRLTKLETKRKNEVQVYNLNTCKEVLKSNPKATSGIYLLKGDIKVYCDMDTDGGGWTAVWSNTGGKTSISKATMSNQKLWYSQNQDIVEPGKYTSQKNTALWNLIKNKKGVELLKINNRTDNNYSTWKNIRFDLGKDVTFGDIMNQGYANNSYNQLSNQVEMFIDEKSYGKTNLLWYQTASIGFANNENNDFPSNTIRSNKMDGWKARHVISYVHNSKGRDTTRCQTKCWSSSPTTAQEVIWFIREKDNQLEDVKVGPYSSGLVAYLPMDNKGNIAPEVINQNNGFVTGTVTGSGRFGNARYFKNAKDSINFDQLLIKGNKTLSFWIKSDRPLSTKDGWEIGFLNDNYSTGTMFGMMYGVGNSQDLGFWGYGSEYDYSIEKYNNKWSSDGIWHNVVLTQNNGKVSIFVDGVKKSLFSHSSGISNQSITIKETVNNYFKIHTRTSDFGGSYKAVDEVAIWNKVLTDSEIDKIYTTKKPIINLIGENDKIFNPTTCLDILKANNAVKSGYFKIKGEEVYCDMETDDGGWTHVATLSDGDVDVWSQINDAQNTGTWETEQAFGEQSFSKDYKSKLYGIIKTGDILIKEGKAAQNNVLKTNGNCIGGKTLSSFFKNLRWNANASDSDWNDSSGAKKCTYKDYGYKDPVLRASASANKEIVFKWGEMDYVQNANKDRTMIRTLTANSDNGNMQVDAPVGLGAFVSYSGKEYYEDAGECRGDGPEKCGDNKHYYQIFAKEEYNIKLNTIVKYKSLKSCVEIKEKDKKAISGVYEVTILGKSLEVYCDMDTDGGGWTLMLSSRDNEYSASSSSNHTTESKPNYNNWELTNENSKLDINENQNTNIMTKAYTFVPFKQMLFKSITSTDYSIYEHSEVSLFDNKKGTMKKKTTSDWPFNLHRVWSSGGIRDINRAISTDTIDINGSCAPSSFRGYKACVKIGIVGLDYYSFQNAIGFGIYGEEWYRERNKMNVPFGYMRHRGYEVMKGDIFVRDRKPSTTVEQEIFNDVIVTREYNLLNSCQEIKERNSSTKNGLYEITLGSTIKTVYCDMETNGGGWTLIARSKPGNTTKWGCSNNHSSDPFGWFVGTGNVVNKDKEYSLAVRDLKFTEIMFGDYKKVDGTDNEWGNYVYRHQVEKDFLRANLTQSYKINLPESIKGGNNSFIMANYIGYTNQKTNYNFRDLTANGFGLYSNGWSTCYGGDGSDKEKQGGYLNTKQGMIMVRDGAPLKEEIYAENLNIINKGLYKNCTEIELINPRAKSGYYNITARNERQYEVYCDMETDGGGWIDVIKTIQKDPSKIKMFFEDDSIVSSKYAKNKKGEEGIVIDYAYGSHQIPIHLNINKTFILNNVKIAWKLQGTEDNYRCNSGNWVPLNGPGYNGNSSGYKASCKTGYNCIQGSTNNGNDKAISANYFNKSIGQKQLLTWSGSNTSYDRVSTNCSRDYDIPSGKAALWIPKLLLKGSITETLELNSNYVTKELTKEETQGLKDCSEIKEKYKEDNLKDNFYETKEGKKYCDMNTDGGGWTLAQRMTIDTSSPDYFENHDGFLNKVRGKGATKVMWKAFKNRKGDSRNGDQPMWAIGTFATGSYNIDSVYNMTSRGWNWRINNAYRNNSLDFYSIKGNVSCTSDRHVHLDYGKNGYNKTDIATFYGCSWDGETSYNAYLLYLYTGHNYNRGYFAKSVSNRYDQGDNSISVYEVYYKTDLNREGSFVDTVLPEYNSNIYKSCKEIKDVTKTGESGIYTINPTGVKEFKVYCDMDTDGGGWTMVLKVNNNNTTQLGSRDYNSWIKGNTFGDTTKLNNDRALGEAYNTVSFDSVLIRDVNNSSNKVAWKHEKTYSSLKSVISQKQTIRDGKLIEGSELELNYNAGCGNGVRPSGRYYGFYVDDYYYKNRLTNMAGAGKTQSGWHGSIIGWGTTNGYSTGYNTTGGIGSMNYSHYQWDMSRHIHGYGNGCNKNTWNGVGSKTFGSNALFIR